MLRRFTSLLIMLALATMLGIVVLRLGDSQAISSPTLTLLGGDGGAYFSTETGFNVVTLRLEGVAAGSGETLTARFDGDGITSSFGLTDLASSAIQGTTDVLNEVPEGVIDGANRDFTSLKAVGDVDDLGGGGADGFVDTADVVVSKDGVQLTASEYGIVTQQPNGSVTLRLFTAPPLGSTVRFSYSTHGFDLIDPSTTPVASVVSASEGGASVGVDSFNASAGTITLQSPPSAGVRNVTITFEIGAIGTVPGAQLGSDSTDLSGNGLSMTLEESGFGTGVFEAKAGLMMVADRSAVAQAVGQGTTVGELLNDAAVLALGLQGDLAALRDGLGLNDSSLAQDLVDRIVEVVDGDTLIAEVSSPGSPVLTTSALIDLQPPAIVAFDPEDGAYRNDSPAFSVRIADAGAGVDTFGVNSVESHLLVVVDDVPYGDSTNGVTIDAVQGGLPGELMAIPNGLPVFTGRYIEWFVDARDRVGNRVSGESLGTLGVPFSATLDATPPTFGSAVAGVGYDSGLGIEVSPRKDSVMLTLDTGFVLTASATAMAGAPIDPLSLAAADFAVDGSTPLAITVVGDTVYLQVPGMQDDATPNVSLVGSLSDRAGNELFGGVQGSAIQAEDGQSPHLVVTVDRSRTKDIAVVTINASEPLQQRPSIVVENGSVQGAITSITGRSWSATVAGSAQGPVLVWVSANDMAGTGQQVVGEDLSSQVDGSRRAFSVEQRRLEQGSVTLTLIQANLNGAGGMTATQLPIEPSAVDLAAGTIRLADTASTPALGESLVASYAFQVGGSFILDTVAPAASFEPVPEGNPPVATAVAGAFWITAHYNEPVTLVDASMDSRDVLGDFFTTDRQRHVLSISSLGSGEHVLRVVAMDDAGNVGALQTYTVVIAQSEAFDLVFKPGWNLVSVPAPLTDPNVNTALAALSSARVLVGFDPDLGLLTSLYDDNVGAWFGDVDRIESGQSYWLFTESFETLRVNLLRRSPSGGLLVQRLREGFNYLGVVADPEQGLDPFVPNGVPAKLYLDSLGSAWTQLLRFDPDPALGLQVLTPTSIGWDGVDPAGPDGQLGFGPDGVEGTTDDNAFQKADNVAGAHPTVEAGRGYILLLNRDADLIPQYR